MPGPISRHAAIRIRKDVVFRELEGEMVLLNLATGVYFGLDPVGTRIWTPIEAHRSSDEVVGTLTILRIGVARRASRLTAHAWLECGGVPLLDDVGHYTPILAVALATS